MNVDPLLHESQAGSIDYLGSVCEIVCLCLSFSLTHPRDPPFRQPSAIFLSIAAKRRSFEEISFFLNPSRFLALDDGENDVTKEG